MRKRIVAPRDQNTVFSEADWLDLESVAEVEVTSEDVAHPIEAALLPGHGSGWRAAAPGKQTVRLLFARPQRLQRIRLAYVERGAPRTQEYVLRWSEDGGRSYHEIARQQWHFSPDGAPAETEEHHVDLPAVTTLELSIIPDIGSGNAVASLAQMRLG